MQSGNGATSDLFTSYEHAPSSIAAVPAGSRLAQYLHGGSQASSRSNAWTSPLPQSQPTVSPYALSSQNALHSPNVPSFVPSFAQMSLSEEKELTTTSGLSVAPFSIPSSSQRSSAYGGGNPGVGVLTSSPIMHDAVRAGGPLSHTDGTTASAYMQESYGGTTYFFQPGPAAPIEHPRTEAQDDGRIAVVTSGTFSYQGPPPHIGKFKPKGSAAQTYFCSPEIKAELLHRQLAIQCRAEPSVFPDIPQSVEHFQNLVPLESMKLPALSPAERSAFGGQTTSTVYKATSIRDGMPYCLRRIHNFRLGSPKQLTFADNWKKLIHANVVQLRDVIATRQFGDYSVLFVYDYHPLAETLKFRHFSNRINGMNAGFMDGASKLGGISGGSVQESVIWTYIVQLSSSLRAIHSSGMAARTVDPTKIIVFSKTKLLLSSCGVLDVIAPDTSHNAIQHQQQEDLNGLGRVIVALAMGSLLAARRENLSSSLAIISQHYSNDMKNIISLLLSASQQGSRVRSINEVMPMIGARFYAQLEGSQMKNDLLENELSKELENGRLFRLLCKLNSITERPEFQMDLAWSETGDRYLLKLFRDYLFHQVTESGKPWIDMAHIITCLNKLDAGTQERIQLVSRDGENVLIVSYNDLRRCIENTFRELTGPAAGSGASLQSAVLPLSAPR